MTTSFPYPPKTIHVKKIPNQKTTTKQRKKRKSKWEKAFGREKYRKEKKKKGEKCVLFYFQNCNLI